jgi:TatD DNase family protein
MIPYIDTHAHLSKLLSRGIPAERIPELFAEGFGGIIDIGTDAEDLHGRLETFASLEKVWFSGGIWPAPEAIAARWEQIARLEAHIDAAPKGRVVAVGECGLDRFHNTPDSGVDPGAERELLELQLDLARKKGLPTIIHSREAAAETVSILRHYPGGGIIHCFSYGPEEAAVFLDLGWYLSFAGNATYKNSIPIREALRFVPADRLFLETDAPYLAPAPHRGKTAEPGMVEYVYRLAAELRKIPLEDLAAQTARNVKTVFGIADNFFKA